MAEDLAITCDCAQVRGTLRQVGPRAGARYTCYCSDCRDFVNLLGAEETALDAHRGVSVYQTRASRLELSSGAANLASLHMTQKPTLRWYAACCEAPLFNTGPRARPAFLSVVTACCDAERRERVLGPPRGDVFPEEADPPLDNARPVSMLRMAATLLPRVARDSLGGGWRETPLFDPQTGLPIAEPRRVSPEERAALGSR